MTHVKRTAHAAQRPHAGCTCSHHWPDLTLARAIFKLPAQLAHFLPARSCDRHRGDCMKLLLADDNRDAAQSLGTLLELSNHEVLIAHDGEEALRIARQAMPDAMILDIGMP